MIILRAVADAVAAQAMPLHRDITVTTPFPDNAAILTTIYVPASMNPSRLIDKQGQSRDFAILRELGGRFDIFFNARAGEQLRLEISSAAPARNEHLFPASGLLRSVRRFDGRTVNSVDDFIDAWKQGSPQGAGFEKQVYSGCNPFGHGSDSIHTYKGNINIPADGEWFFYTASTDASFLLINGQLVSAWPGRHWIGEGQRGEYGGSIVLKAGIHRFEYLHANNQHACFAIAAYSGSDKKKLQTIPPNMFTAAQTATAGSLLDHKDNKLPDFTWEQIQMLELPGKAMYKLTFNAAPHLKDVEWDFSDGGGKAQGHSTSRFLFSNTAITVKMNSASGSMSQKVVPAFSYSSSMLEGKKALNLLDEALDQELRYGIQDSGYRFLAEAITTFNARELATRFHPRLMDKQKLVPQFVIIEFFRQTRLKDLEDKERYAEALKELRELLGRADTPALSAALKLEIASLLLYKLGQYREAASTLSEEDIKALGRDSKIRAAILAADAALMTSDLQSAANLYAAIPSPAKKMDAIRKLQLAGMVVNIRNAIVLKRYQDALEYIQTLENADPLTRLNPELTLNRGLALNAMGKPMQAKVCFEMVIRQDPAPPTLARACLELVRFHAARQERSEALRYAAIIARQTPDAHEAIEVGKIIDNLSTGAGKP